jgi:hypothetical protein
MVWPVISRSSSLDGLLCRSWIETSCGSSFLAQARIAKPSASSDRPSEMPRIGVKRSLRVLPSSNSHGQTM